MRIKRIDFIIFFQKKCFKNQLERDPSVFCLKKGIYICANKNRSLKPYFQTK
jgi:hypothetical protein